MEWVNAHIAIVLILDDLIIILMIILYNAWKQRKFNDLEKKVDNLTIVAQNSIKATNQFTKYLKLLDEQNELLKKKMGKKK